MERSELAELLHMVMPGLTVFPEQRALLRDAASEIARALEGRRDKFRIAATDNHMNAADQGIEHRATEASTSGGRGFSLLRFQIGECLFRQTWFRLCPPCRKGFIWRFHRSPRLTHLSRVMRCMGDIVLGVAYPSADRIEPLPHAIERIGIEFGDVSGRPFSGFLAGIERPPRFRHFAVHLAADRRFLERPFEQPIVQRGLPSVR